MLSTLIFISKDIGGVQIKKSKKKNPKKTSILIKSGLLIKIRFSIYTLLKTFT